MQDESQTAVRTERTMGPYTLLRRLGAGGMGEVWLANDRRLGRNVALKFIHRDKAFDPDRVRRFLQEARTASALNHPNIVTVHELGESDGVQYIATEFIDGETLRHRMSRGLTSREATAIAVQIASALSAAHKAGVVHRDIKPENVMIRRDGIVRVVDFGLAKLVDTDLASTEDGMVRGTYRYMSPEQSRGEPVDARTDLWSLGLVLQEMLGDRPPARLRRVIAKALQKDRELRYQSADAMLEDLRAREPMRVTRVVVPLATAAVIATGAWLVVQRRAAPRVVEARSVAVLPFANLSGDPANDFLSDGMTEELINALARAGELKVVSRTSSFAFKGKNTDVREVANALGVTSVVEGSVRKAGNRLRVSAELVDAKNGYDVWSETFDRDVNDVFAIQDGIAAAVAQALSAKLAPHTHKSPDFGAYELFVNARKERDKQTPEAVRSAIAMFREAADRDPHFADAWAEMADTYGILDHVASVTLDDTRANHIAALDASNRALAIDPNNALAHAAVGHILTHDGDFAEAERRLRTALRLNANSAGAHLWLAVLLTVTGHYADAKPHMLRARELDPLSLQVATVGAFMMSDKGDYAVAEDFARHMVRLAPDNVLPFLTLARILAMEGRRADAEAALEEASHKPGDSPDAVRAIVEAIFGEKAKARAILGNLDDNGADAGRNLMEAWTAAGDVDRAIAILERRVRRNPSMERISIDIPPHPAFAALRNDPRYRRVRQELGLPALR